MKDENKQNFITKDFYVSAFLVTKGHKIISVDRKEPHRVFFSFKNFEGRENLVRSFLFGQAMVEPQSFITSIKSIKQLLHTDE